MYCLDAFDFLTKGNGVLAQARSAFGRLRGPRQREPKQIVDARHVELSVISSLDDQEPKASEFLIRTLAEAAMKASDIDISTLRDRCKTSEERLWIETWPGEHYKLLPALALTLGVKRAVEVGTYHGQGTLALRLGCPEVMTYDIYPFDSFTGSVLSPEDFGDGISQRIGDLSNPTFFRNEQHMLQSADLVFVDGPKDGVFEKKFAELLYPLLKDSKTIVVWDDIKLMKMVDFWRWLPAEKLDATTFGHWSGTGITTT